MAALSQASTNRLTATRQLDSCELVLIIFFQGRQEGARGYVAVSSESFDRCIGYISTIMPVNRYGVQKRGKGGVEEACAPVVTLESYCLLAM
jgi:hypothetical protein